MTKIRSIMKKTVDVNAEDTLINLAKLLKKHSLTGVPVINSKKIVIGFVSERDIVSAVPRKDFSMLVVKNIMKKKVISLKPDDPVTKATKIFSLHKFRLVPVIKNGKIAGIIRRNDVIEYMLHI